MNDARTIAIGCMRLSTDPDRDDDRSVDVLHAAFDAGVTLLDTAEAYCHDERDIGHNALEAAGNWTDGRSIYGRLANEAVVRWVSIASRSINCTRRIHARRCRRASGPLPR